MTRIPKSVTRYDLAVETWNDLNPNQRQARRAECRKDGHDYHTLPGTGGVRVCYWCCSYLDPEDQRKAAA